MPAAALALDAAMVIAGHSGRRDRRGDGLLPGPLHHRLAEAEILVEIRVPKHTDWGAAYEKF